MEIVLTGTGSPLPDANRAGPSTLLKAGDTLPCQGVDALAAGTDAYGWSDGVYSYIESV